MTNAFAGGQFNDLAQYSDVQSLKNSPSSIRIIAAPIHREWVGGQLQRVCELLNGAAVKLVVVPIGPAGELIWKRLPAQIAVFVASICPEALIFTRTLERGQPEPANLIEFIDSVNEKNLIILPPITPPEDDSHLPQLVPSPFHVPQPIRHFVFSHPRNGPDATALQAGLLLVVDDLHGSHELSQNIEGEGLHHAGDYWHAIMHRREPDYGNSKYWFRRVGSQPLFPKLAEIATAILKNCSVSEATDWLHKLTRHGWDAMAFVDLCEQCSRCEDSPLGIATRRIQWMEMLLLLDQTCRDAGR
jgi:hypothetical protein